VEEQEMSHFSVLVIGENVEKQLEPYDENIRVPVYCTGVVTEADKQRMLEFYMREKGEKFKTFDECYKVHGKDWNDNDWRKDSTIWKEYSTYNKKSKWDWYSVGGRWAGYLKLKESAKKKYKDSKPDFSWGWDKKEIKKILKEGRVDQALKKDIDFEGMRKDAGLNANKLYEKVENLFGGEIPKIGISWEEIYSDNKKYAKLTSDEKRELYHAQPALKKLHAVRKELNEKQKSNPKDKKIEEASNLMAWLELDKYQCTKQEFIKRAEDTSFETFAVVKDGEWFEKGEMGWWACVSNEKEEAKWQEEFNKLVEGLPGNTLLTIVDCHI
jgi:hypothetical protein